MLVKVLQQARSYKESDDFASGTDVVVATTALCTLGMTVCYDLRFAELYRKLADEGAQIITVPAAFTAATGKDHWQVLLRARAIENQYLWLVPIWLIAIIRVVGSGVAALLSILGERCWRAWMVMKLGLSAPRLI